MATDLRHWLAQWQAGEIDTAELEAEIIARYSRTGGADFCWDSNRRYRTGRPEAVLATGKSTAQLAAICEELCGRGEPFLLTRVTAEQARETVRRFPQLVWHERARILQHEQLPPKHLERTIAIITAGSSDISVAEEAAVTLEFLGYAPQRYYDRGVAGLHRLLAVQDELAQAAVCIVVAGMEGALPTVVGGLVPGAVIAVPTSVGYGASFGGVAALLGMLNSCADKVAVVNIDNGYGAACVADSICYGRSHADAVTGSEP